MLCREDGGVLDDLFTYRIEVDRFLTVTNAANHVADLAWFEGVAADFPEARVSDRIDDWAMLAVQGPIAREIVQAGADSPLPERMTVGRRRLGGAEVLVCGTGYTGEDGVELLCSPEQAPALWDEVVRRGAHPAGLGARDTLRLEVCFHLYGNELSVERGPIEAGLGWCCKEDTGFIGAESVRAVREEGAGEKLIAFTIDGPGIARQGNPSRAAASSRAERSRRRSASGSAWPTCRPTARPSERSSRSTCADGRGRRPWRRSRS